MAYVPGPFDREHGVLVWGGSLPGEETWSCSLRLAETEQGIGANDAAGWDVQVLLDHYTTAVKDFHARPTSMISPQAKLQFVKFNRVDINGHYIDPTSYINTFADWPGGGAATPVYPNQVALVVTLTTAVSRGPASKGRFYLPLPSVAVETGTGMIAATWSTGIAGSAKTFLELVSDTPGVDDWNTPGVVVMSRKLGAPQTRRVNGAKVGRVLDTQRRRRRSLAENYALTVIDQGEF